MMHEESKIKEAEYFLQRLPVEGDEAATRYHASAFLSAARSALQYALEEAKLKPNGETWYVGAVTSDAVMKFLKDRRDVNIHKRPLPMRTNVFIQIPVPGEDGRVAFTYEFKDWIGPEDLPTLFHRYLCEIKRVVEDGRARGFLSQPSD